jgi:hypothetical protein
MQSFDGDQECIAQRMTTLPAYCTKAPEQSRNKNPLVLSLDQEFLGLPRMGFFANFAANPSLKLIEHQC